MNRREALRGIAIGAGISSAGIAGGVGVGISIAVASKAEVAQDDPALIAISRHREARRIFETFDDEGPGYREADEAEWDAWEALTQTVPTTLGGVAAMCSYVERHVRKTGQGMDLGAARALINIATGAMAIELADEKRRGV